MLSLDAAKANLKAKDHVYSKVKMDREIALAELTRTVLVEFADEHGIDRYSWSCETEYDNGECYEGVSVYAEKYEGEELHKFFDQLEDMSYSYGFKRTAMLILSEKKYYSEGEFTVKHLKELELINEGR